MTHRIRSAAPAAVELPFGLSGRASGGEGPGVLWLHPHTLDSSVWAELWVRLPEWRHLGVDLPGHGASGHRGNSETLSDLARLLGVISAERGLSHVVGLSLGSLVALQLAMECPTLFDSLVLAGPHAGGLPVPAQTDKRYREIVNMFRIGGAGPHIRGRWMDFPPSLFDGFPRDGPLWEQLREVVDGHEWAELRDGTLFRYFGHRQPGERIRRISMPTLLMVGEGDFPETHRCGMTLATRIPGAKLEVVEGAGHLSVLERPEAAAAVIANHLRAADEAEAGRDPSRRRRSSGGNELPFDPSVTLEGS